MATLHINPSTTETLTWIATDRCMFCGSEQGEGKERYACFCRECDSCTSRWVASTRKDLNDGRPVQEDCPDCVEPKLIVKRPYMRHPPCAVECRCDGNQVYAAIGDPSAAIRGESSGVIGFGDTLADALRSLANEIEKEVEVIVC